MLSELLDRVFLISIPVTAPRWLFFRSLTAV